MFDFTWLFNGQFKFLDNPFAVAIIIVLTTMIIFYFIMHKDVVLSDLLWTGLYSAVAVYIIIALHYRNLVKEFDTKTETVKGAGVMSNIAASVAGGGLTPVLAQSAPQIIYMMPAPAPVPVPAPIAPAVL